eukprot:2074987-Rhodomonas_salina.1
MHAAEILAQTVLRRPHLSSLISGQNTARHKTQETACLVQCFIVFLRFVLELWFDFVLGSGFGPSRKGRGFPTAHAHSIHAARRAPYARSVPDMA